MSSSSSDASSESDSFSSIQADFERLAETLSHFQNNLENVGENLGRIQKPIENLEIEQLHNPDFLSKSPFRTQTFLIKNPEFSTIHEINLNKRYFFYELCAMLRNYIFRMKLLNTDGTIRVNEPLKKLLKVKTEGSIMYLDLLAGLIHILA